MIIKGDTDFNGRITADDMALIAISIFGGKTLTDDEFTACDVNSDGKVNSGDLVMVKQHVAGIRVITEVVY